MFSILYESRVKILKFSIQLAKVEVTVLFLATMLLNLREVNWIAIELGYHKHMIHSENGQKLILEVMLPCWECEHKGGKSFFKKISTPDEKHIHHLLKNRYGEHATIVICMLITWVATEVASIYSTPFQG